MVLQNGGKLTACATAAGPAFEGCGLRCGTRAREGAVSDLRLTLNPFQLETKTIGNIPLARANGLCGSAYVDFLATARSSGLLGVAGRFTAAAWENVPAQNRFTDEGERALRLTETNGAGALRVSEVDVALLLQAKAAIGAGIEILLETAGIRATDLGRVYLAGGFGMHLNVAHAIAIGLPCRAFTKSRCAWSATRLWRVRCSRWWTVPRSTKWKICARRSRSSN